MNAEWFVARCRAAVNRTRNRHARAALRALADEIEAEATTPEKLLDRFMATGSTAPTIQQICVLGNPNQSTNGDQR